MSREILSDIDCPGGKRYGDLPLRVYAASSFVVSEAIELLLPRVVGELWETLGEGVDNAAGTAKDR